MDFIATLVKQEQLRVHCPPSPVKDGHRKSTFWRFFVSFQNLLPVGGCRPGPDIRGGAPVPPESCTVRHKSHDLRRFAHTPVLDPTYEYLTEDIALFWRPHPVFSQWSPSTFVVDGVSCSGARRLEMDENDASSSTTMRLDRVRCPSDLQPHNEGFLATLSREKGSHTL